MHTAGYKVERLTLAQRLGAWLFPRRHFSHGLDHARPLHTWTNIRLSWADRLRLLVSGRAELQVVAATIDAHDYREPGIFGVRVERGQTVSHFTALPPKFMER
jgi:hypothetical protein